MESDMNKVIETLENGMKKHTSISVSFRKELLSFVKKNITEVQVVANKFKFDVTFFELFSKQLEKDSDGKIIDEKNYYKHFNRLRKFKLIHQRSSSFARSLALKSINPNHHSLLIDDFTKLDDFIATREKIIFLMNSKNDYSLHYFYIYLRIFALETLPKKELEDFRVKNIIPLAKNKTIQYIEQAQNFLQHSACSYKIYIYDTEVVNILQTIFHNETEKIFRDIDKFETFWLEFKKKYFPSLRMQTLKYLNRNYYILHTSLLYVTIFQKIVPTVPITISEIDKLFPGKVPNEFLINEQFLIDTITAKKNIEQDEIDIIQKNKFDEDRVSGLSIQEFDNLMHFMHSKNNFLDKKLVISIISEFNLYLAIDSSKHANMIIEYFQYIFELHLKNKLRASTIRGYIWTLNKHVLKSFIDLDDIQPYELNNLQYRLSSGKYKKSSNRTILKVLNRFFKYHNKSKLGTTHLLNYPKSFIFEDELDEILNSIDNKTQLEHKRIGKHDKLYMLQKQVVVLFAYYGNGRKNEIRTRLTSDIHVFENEIYLDINNEGLKKQKLKLKSNSAKRRIKITMNQKHMNIIKEWYGLRMKLTKRSKFLFLARSTTGGFLNTSIEETVFDVLNRIIKDVTKRYCTFHSLRHSCSTNTISNYLIIGDINPYLLLEHAIEMGHSIPDITLSSYVHADFIRLMK